MKLWILVITNPDGLTDETIRHAYFYATLPNAPEIMMSCTVRLRDELAPLGVKVITIGREGEIAGTEMIDSESGTWPDIAALADGIIRHSFRLPGEARVL